MRYFFFQKANDTEMLCKAATIALESRDCHTHLEGIYLNLLSLIQRKSTAYKVRQGSALTVHRHHTALKRSARPASSSITVFAFSQPSPAPPRAAKTRLENQLPPPASILKAFFFFSSYYRHHVLWQQATLLH